MVSWPLGSHILIGNTTVAYGTGRLTDGRKTSSGGGVESIVSHVAGTWHGNRPPGEGVGEGVFLVWTQGTWGEQMFTGEHFFSISATRIVSGC